MEIARSISDRIVSGVFPLHGRLPSERDLSDQLGVSRANLRGALRVLEAEGRVWRQVGKGTFVGSAPTSTFSSAEELGSRATLAELMEVRHVFEPLAARLASQHARQSDIELIHEYLDLTAKADDWAMWGRADDLLHRAIAEASRNAVLIHLMDTMTRAKRASRMSFAKAFRFDQRIKNIYLGHHVNIVDAIVRHDPNGAEAAMSQHMTAINMRLGVISRR